jgi:signal transduction histidine kinase
MLGELHLLNEDRRFLARLSAGMPPEDTRWMGLVISGARLSFAFVAVLATRADATEPEIYANWVYGLLISYLVFSVAVFCVAYFRAEAAKSARVALHLVDIVWFSVITTLSQGPSSPMYVFLLFILLAAAYQWGFRETLATTSIMVLLLCVQVVLILIAPVMGSFALQGGFELNRYIMRSTFLPLMGALLGYLSEQEKVHQAEANLIARILARLQAERGLRASLDTVISEILRVFHSERALLLLQEKQGARAFQWEARKSTEGRHAALQLSELDSREFRTLLSSEPVNILYAQRSQERGTAAWKVTALDAAARRVHGQVPTILDSLPGASEARSVLLAWMEVSAQWSGPVIVFDPQLGFNKELELRFLQRLLREVGPAAYSVYLVRRLRARVGAVERARVARELHDGAIQSLVALEMHMEVLRRPGATDPAHWSERLADIQQLLHQEVLNLRELMEQIKPLEVGPQELLEHLAEKVEKFRRETGIAASFVCQIEEVTLPARAAREVSRIVQEALVNIRKHSAAHNVLVRLSASDSCWQLSIDDDGRGFGFSGRLSQAELDAARAGPVVIKERVRALGGELSVDSRPGKGARLEISIPQRTHA